MDSMSFLKQLLYKVKYQRDFFRHTSGKGLHKVSDEDKRLREVILKNYGKSCSIFNLLAVYLNYIRRNKSFTKTVITHFLLTLVGTVVAFRANERLFHLDYLLKYIDPQILVNSRNLSETKENNKFKFFQSLVLKDIETKNCN